MSEYAKLCIFHAKLLVIYTVTAQNVGNFAFEPPVDAAGIFCAPESLWPYRRIMRFLSMSLVYVIYLLGNNIVMDLFGKSVKTILLPCLSFSLPSSIEINDIFYKREDNGRRSVFTVRTRATEGDGISKVERYESKPQYVKTEDWTESNCPIILDMSMTEETQPKVESGMYTSLCICEK